MNPNNSAVSFNIIITTTIISIITIMITRNRKSSQYFWSYCSNNHLIASFKKSILKWNVCFYTVVKKGRCFYFCYFCLLPRYLFILWYLFRLKFWLYKSRKRGALFSRWSLGCLSRTFMFGITFAHVAQVGKVYSLYVRAWKESIVPSGLRLCFFWRKFWFFFRALNISLKSVENTSIWFTNSLGS